MASPPPEEQVQAIWTKTVKEQELGVLGPFHTRDFCDSEFGADGWRALKRFAVKQHGDWRVIDNG
eukprot:11965493-Heterocapsa_arctica.AAC.1